MLFCISSKTEVYVKCYARSWWVFATYWKGLHEKQCRLNALNCCMFDLSNVIFPAILQCLLSPSVKSWSTTVGWWRLNTGSTTNSWWERTATYLALVVFLLPSPWWTGASPLPPESSSPTLTPARCLTLTYQSLAPAPSTSLVAVSSSLY